MTLRRNNRGCTQLRCPALEMAPTVGAPAGSLSCAATATASGASTMASASGASPASRSRLAPSREASTDHNPRPSARGRILDRRHDIVSEAFAVRRQVGIVVHKSLDRSQRCGFAA